MPAGSSWRSAAGDTFRQWTPPSVVSSPPFAHIVSGSITLTMTGPGEPGGATPADAEPYPYAGAYVEQSTLLKLGMCGDGVTGLTGTVNLDWMTWPASSTAKTLIPANTAATPGMSQV